MENVLNKNSVVDIPSWSSKEVLDIKIPKKYLNDIHFVDLCLLDKKGNLLSENFYWLSAKRDFTSLANLTDVKLDVSIKRYIKGTSSLIKIRMTNPSPGLAFFINPRIHKGKRGGEILPSFWSDSLLNCHY